MIDLDEVVVKLLAVSWERSENDIRCALKPDSRTSSIGIHREAGRFRAVLEAAVRPADAEVERLRGATLTDRMRSYLPPGFSP